MIIQRSITSPEIGLHIIAKELNGSFIGPSDQLIVEASFVTIVARKIINMTNYRPTIRFLSSNLKWLFYFNDTLHEVVSETEGIKILRRIYDVTFSSNLEALRSVELGLALVSEFVQLIHLFNSPKVSLVHAEQF